MSSPKRIIAFFVSVTHRFFVNEFTIRWYEQKNQSCNGAANDAKQSHQPSTVALTNSHSDPYNGNCYPDEEPSEDPDG